jgi:FixJ family two-component response regulator
MRRWLIYFLPNESACPLIQILSERRIPIVITTGTDIDLGYPALGKAVAFLQKPYNDSELIEALVEWAVPALLASLAISRDI